MFFTFEEKFERYASDIKKLSEISAKYLLKDDYCKQGYRSEIAEVVRLIRADFYRAIYNHRERYNRTQNLRDTVREAFGVGFLPDIMQYLNEIEVEYETEMSAYSQLRKRSKETYELTKTFSGTGYYFYLKSSQTIIGGGIQSTFGYLTFKIGRKIRSKEMQGAGIIGITLGGGKFIEGISDIVYEFTEDGVNFGGDPVKENIEKGLRFLGMNESHGEIGYDIIDMTVSLYNGFAAFAKYDSPNRIIHLPVTMAGRTYRATYFDRLFTSKGVRLFRWSTLDFKRKFSIQSKPLLLTTLSYNAGKLILILKKYKNDESSSENTQ